VPLSRRHERTPLPASTPLPAIWCEHVDDTEHVAFRQPLATVMSQSLAVGEMVDGPRAGTLILIPIRPPAR
jgi:hypothetical protein